MQSGSGVGERVSRSPVGAGVIDIRRAIVLSSVGSIVIVLSWVAVVSALKPPLSMTIVTAIADLGMIVLTARSLHLALSIERRAHDIHKEGSALRASLVERRVREAHLRHLAFHDPLTGLPNRALFKELLLTAYGRACREGNPLALMMIDVDSFKGLNDALGHRGGDVVLRAVAERIRECLRTSDYAARLGGDEFAIILEDIESPGEAISIATRVAESMEGPVLVQDSEVRVTVSTGIVVMDQPAGDPLHVLHRADLAMYQAKRSNKGGYALWTPDILDDAALSLAERRAVAVD